MMCSCYECDKLCIMCALNIVIKSPLFFTQQMDNNPSIFNHTTTAELACLRERIRALQEEKGTLEHRVEEGGRQAQVVREQTEETARRLRQSLDDANTRIQEVNLHTGLQS